MAWTTPKTWAVDELVTASMMNTHLRDNLNALKAPPTAHYECDEASDYTVTNTSFEDVDSTNLALTITTHGGDLLVGFCGSLSHSVNWSPVYFNVALDDTNEAGDDGITFALVSSAGGQPVSFVYLITGVSAAEHTIKLRWKVSTGTATLFAGAGTSGADVHPQFWVREIS